MEDYAKSILRKVCCTCLSIDRKLIQLYKLKDGVNNLFFLVSADSEAYEAMFRRDVTQLFICWECEAFMSRQRRFIDRVCVAQKQLSQIVDGQTDLKPLYNLSRLIRVHNNSYDKEFVYADSTIDNFIDCGPNINIDIKTESSIALINIDHEISSVSDEEFTTIDEIKVLENKLEIKPLSINKRKSKNLINKRGRVKRKDDNEESIKEAESELKDVTELLCNKTEDEPLDNNRKLNNETVLEKKVEIESLLKKKKVKKEEEFIKEDGFSRIRMTEEELLESIEKRKLENDFVLASNKCESCVEAFKNHTDLEEHNSRLHLQKPKFIQCDICLVYFKFWWVVR